MLTILLAETDPKIKKVLHVVLLNLQSSILNNEGRLRVFIHFRDNRILELARNVEIPLNFGEFEKFFESLESKKGTFEDILDVISPDEVVVMSPSGKEDIEIFSNFDIEDDVLVVVGGFTEGDLSANIYDKADYVVSLSKKLLKIWTVVNEVVVTYEKNIKG